MSDLLSSKFGRAVYALHNPRGPMSDAALADDTLTNLAEGVCLFPDDDTPRLVAADRFEELGDESRAAFIRVQCELAKPAPEPEAVAFGDLAGADAAARRYQTAVAKRGTLRERVRELREDNGRRWARPLANLVNVMAPITGDELHWMGNVILKWEWSRGFISSLTCTAEEWLRHERLLAWPPASVACPRCEGWGAVAASRQASAYQMSATCSACSGSGRLTLPRPTDPCRAPGPHHHGDVCNGGRVQSPNAQFTRECGVCNGAGRVPRPFPQHAQPVSRVTWTAYLQADRDTLAAKWRAATGKPSTAIPYMSMFRELWPHIDLQFAPGINPAPPTIQNPTAASGW